MITDEEFAELPVSDSYPQLETLLERMAAGEAVQLATLGGSFTDGMDCKQTLADGKIARGLQCSWTYRFLYWLRETFPQAKISVQHWNRGGTASCPHLVMLPLLLRNFLRSSSLDLVMLDTLVNGNFEPYQDSYCYEGIIRTLHEVTPSTAVFSLLAGPPGMFKMPLPGANLRAEEAVCHHYGVPVVNFGTLGLAKPSLWEHCCGHALVHPTWRTHQLVADLVSSFFGRVWAARCAGPSRSVVAPLWPKATYYPEETLANYGTCSRPVSSYSAFDAAGWDGNRLSAEPAVLAGEWTRYEDRPGKPGWISTTRGSKISFNVTFGKKPNILIAFLRSYEGLGIARVEIILSEPYRKHQLMRANLDGTWGERVSQTAIYRVVEGFQPLFHLPPNGSANVSFELTKGPKFKIIGVYSC